MDKRLFNIVSGVCLIMLGELMAMGLWATNLSPGSLAPVAGVSLLIISAVWWRSVRPYLWFVLVFTLGILLENNELVSRTELAQIASGKVDVRLTLTASPSYRLPGAAQVAVQLMDRELPAYGVVRYPDLPWEKLQLSPGTIIEGQLRLMRSRSAAGFSWPDWDIRHGVAFRGQLTDVVVKNDQPNELSADDLPLRLQLASSLIESFGYSRALAVVISSSAGFGGLLDEQTVDLFKQTGLYHILVVSGSHVSFIYFLVSTIALRLLATNWLLLTLFRLRTVGAVIGFIAAALFVQFTGAEPPAVRALFALLVFLFAELLLRSTSRAESYVYVVGAMLIVYPGCFLDAGPMLTFAAVLGLQIGFQILNGLKSEEEKGVLRKIYSAALVSFIVWIFTAPWLCLFFDRLSPLSFLFNLIFGAVFSAAVCLGGLIVGGIYALGLPSEFLIRGLCWVTERIVLIIEIVYEQTARLGFGEVLVDPQAKMVLAGCFLAVNLGLILFQARKHYMLQRYCIPS